MSAGATQKVEDHDKETITNIVHSYFFQDRGRVAFLGEGVSDNVNASDRSAHQIGDADDYLLDGSRNGNG